MVDPYSRFTDNCRPFLITQRLEIGWKQKDIEEMTGISRASYAQIESGLREGTAEQWAHLQRIFCQPSELLRMHKTEYFDYMRDIEGGCDV